MSERSHTLRETRGGPDGQVRALLASFRHDIEQRESSLGALRSELEAERIRCGTRAEALKVRRARLEEAKAALTLERARAFGADGLVRPVLHGLRQADRDSARRVGERRRRRAQQLLELFPIVPPAGGRHRHGTIAGLALPSVEELLSRKGYAASEAENVGAALALVVRLVELASRYLALPLPFRIEFHGSWAAIGHWGSSASKRGGGPPMLALRPLSVAAAAAAAESAAPPGALSGESGAAPRATPSAPSERSFAKGLRMLCENVAYLCLCQGVAVSLSDRGQLLESLWQLLHAPSLGRSAREGLEHVQAQEERAKEQRYRQRFLPSASASPAPVEIAPGAQEGADVEDEWTHLDAPQPPKPSAARGDVAAWEEFVM